MKKLIEQFLTDFKKGLRDIDSIYNSASLKFELGQFLRQKIGKDYLFEYERSLNSLWIEKDENHNNEIDIVIYKGNIYDPEERLAAIEIINTRENVHHDTMADFINDIHFLEHLRKKGFKNTFSLIVSDEEKEDIVLSGYSLNWEPLWEKTSYILVEVENSK